MTRQVLAVFGVMALAGMIGSSMAERAFAHAMHALSVFLTGAVN